MLKYKEVFSVHDDLSTPQHFFMPQPACLQTRSCCYIMVVPTHMGSWDNGVAEDWENQSGHICGDWQMGIEWGLSVVLRAQKNKTKQHKKNQPEKHM